jgi:hypothetical protein
VQWSKRETLQHVWHIFRQPVVLTCLHGLPSSESTLVQLVEFLQVQVPRQ